MSDEQVTAAEKGQLSEKGPALLSKFLRRRRRSDDES